MKKKLKKYAVLASGNGSTLQAIIDAIENNELDELERILLELN